MALFVNGFPSVQPQQLGKVRHGQLHPALQRSFALLFQSVQHPLITQGEGKGHIGRHVGRRRAFACNLHENSDIDFSDIHLLLPALGKLRHQAGLYGIRIRLLDALDVITLPRFFEPLRPAHDCVVSGLLLFRGSAAAQHLHSHRHEMRADQSAVLVVTAGTKVVGIASRFRYLEFRTHPARTEIQGPGNHRRFIVHLFHHPAGEERFTVAKSAPSRPILEVPFCKWYLLTHGSYIVTLF